MDKIISKMSSGSIDGRPSCHNPAQIDSPLIPHGSASETGSSPDEAAAGSYIREKHAAGWRDTPADREIQPSQPHPDYNLREIKVNRRLTQILDLL